jgi:hypothetical protein
MLQPDLFQLQSADFGARRLGVDLQRFYGLVRLGILPPGVVVRLGRRISVNVGELEAFIASGGASLPGGWRRGKAD